MASLTVTADANSAIALSGVVTGQAGSAGSQIDAIYTPNGGSPITIGTLSNVPDGPWSMPPVTVPPGTGIVDVVATSVLTVTATGTVALS